MTGLSNGGAMAHRMACEAADVVRSVATVSFPLNLDHGPPSRPITVYSIAATGDTTLPYNGLNQDAAVGSVAGVPIRVQSAPASLAAWKGNDGCSAKVTSTTPIPGKVLEDVYRQCNGGVRTGLLTIVGGEPNLDSGGKGAGSAGSGINAPTDVADYLWTDVFTD